MIPNDGNLFLEDIPKKYLSMTLPMTFKGTEDMGTNDILEETVKDGIEIVLKKILE